LPSSALKPSPKRHRRPRWARERPGLAECARSGRTGLKMRCAARQNGKNR
jgi:hypothetical protein